MTVFWIILALAAVLLATTTFLAKRRGRKPWCPKPEVTASDIILAANGRTIIIGENHGDREARKKILMLFEAANSAGYKVLGVECSDTGHDEHPGLRSEVSFIAAHLKEPLSEDHKHSELDPNEEGIRCRMNRHWQIQMALCLGWRVESFDPNYWNHLSGDADGYLYSREPAMAEILRSSQRMIAVCGYAHLEGLHVLLGDSVIMACASKPDLSHTPPDSFWMRRIKFAMRVPLLVD